jgi:TonB family protein
MKMHVIMLLSILLFVIRPTPAVADQEKSSSTKNLSTLLEAAGTGEAKSQCELAKAYLEGSFGQRDYAEAIKYFRRAANQNLAEAQNWMGMIYEHGLGGQRDYSSAVKWYRKAAGQGDASAQLNLGLMYCQAKGVRKNLKDAAMWFAKAAEQGNSFAQLTLAWMYFQGDGVTKDIAEAAKWFRNPAEQGDSSAQCALGTIYIDGTSVQQDPVQAYLWFDQCATYAQGKKKEMAVKIREEIAAKIKPEQIKEARQAAINLDLGNIKMYRRGPFLVSGDTIAPAVIFNPIPQYTEKARQNRAQGIIVLGCVVRKDGTVNSLEVLTDLGYGLAQSAINTIASKWRFKPGRYQGEPVNVQTVIEVSFRLY